MEEGRKISSSSGNSDRISELPDEIRVSILSLLSLKEAASTSTLSKRWQHVWTSTTNLTFDFAAANLEVVAPKTPRGYCLQWVSRVIQQHRGPNVERFRVCFDSDCPIDTWIQFAVTKKVEILELEVSRSSKDFGSYKINPPNPPPKGFSLKLLRFEWVHVTGHILEHFLANCPFLDRLIVRYSKVSGSLRVVGPSISLKHLEIFACRGIKSIEVHESNLVSLVYSGDPINLLLSNVPLLADVEIYEEDRFNNADIDYIGLVFNQLSPVLSQLEVLMLDIDQAIIRAVMNNMNHEVPALENLKHLELIVEAGCYWGLHQLNSYMKACPFLQRFVLKLQFPTWRGSGRKLKTAPSCRHHHLKVVEIVGYRARKIAAKQVLYFVRNAVALEKIVIDPCLRLYRHCTQRQNSAAELLKEEVMGRDHAMQHVKRKVPSTIEFVCL